MVSKLFSVTIVVALTLSVTHPELLISLPSYERGVFAEQGVSEERKSYTSAPLPVRYVSDTVPYTDLLFVGDVLLARNIEVLMKKHGAEYPYLGLKFKNLFERPAVVSNFEAAVPVEHQPTPIKMINFSVHEQYLPALQTAGFQYHSLANNHSYDFGQSGFSETKQAFSEQGIEYFGHPTNLSRESVSFIEVGDKTIAVVGVHTLTRLPSYSEIRSVMEYASFRSDVQIIYPHWGEEYSLTHSKRQHDVAQRFIALGADAIVGHHPHVVQDIELIDEVPVLYSLGNYIFDQYDSRDTQIGLVAHFDFYDGGRITLIPVSSEDSYSQPRPLNSTDHAKYLQDLSKRSDPELKEYIQDGSIPLYKTVAESAKMAMMSQ